MKAILRTSGAASRAPRYQHLTAQLAREIGEGHYPVGSLLPPEPVLCRRFAVSRHTVREAVRQLCEQGLVSRHQGVGTRVRARQAHQQYVASLSSLGDLMAYAQRTTLKLLGSRDVTANAALARQLRCAEGEQWLELDTCRSGAEGGEPIVHMRVFVRPECRGIRDALERRGAWIYGLVEKYGGERILEAQQIVGAVAVPAASARVLGVRSGSPGMLVRRFYVGRDQRLLSVSLNVYPAGRFEFTTTWRLEEAARERERSRGGQASRRPAIR